MQATQPDQTAQLACLLMPEFYRQYLATPPQWRRHGVPLANSQRSLALQYGITRPVDIGRAIRWLEEHHMLAYNAHRNEENAPLLDSQTIGDVTLTREGTELCRKLMRERGPASVAQRSEAQVAMKLTGFYITTLIERGVRNRAKLAEAMHFSRDRINSWLRNLAAQGAVWINTTGAIVGILAFAHGKDGFYNRLRERYDNESAVWADSVDGPVRAAAKLAAKRAAQAARAASRATRLAFARGFRDAQIAAAIASHLPTGFRYSTALLEPVTSSTALRYGDAAPVSNRSEGPLSAQRHATAPVPVTLRAAGQALEDQSQQQAGGKAWDRESHIRYRDQLQLQYRRSMGSRRAA
jgi:hypothetical protein